MILEKKILYHIYNQGNNRQKIFFSRDNYLYFLEKVNKLLLPYVDVIAWCLMPNHFHFLVYVKEYPQVCWNYIHNNPIEANTVKKPEDWEYSSYRDFLWIT